MREAADEGLDAAAGAVADGEPSRGSERVAAAVVVGEENVDVLEGGAGKFGRRVVEPNP